jgi:hypothetical protein
MPTLNIRNVPDPVVTRLKQRAERNGRSLNAEIVAVLEDAASARTVAEVLDELDDFARLHPLSPGAPMPEELIREDRDSH